MNQRGHLINAGAVGAVTGALWAYPSDPLTVVVETVGVATAVVLGALLPDADVSIGRHRKTLHNLPLLAFLLAAPMLIGNLHWVWLGALVHYVGDVLCSGRGLALLYPLTDREYLRWSMPRHDARPIRAALTVGEIAAVVYLLV